MTAQYPGMILHIYGPFAIYWYGTMIVAGLLFFYLVARHHHICRQYLSDDALVWFMLLNVCAAFIGGRVLSLLPEGEWPRWHHFYYGGFSMFGSMGGIMLTIALYAKSKKIPILLLFDLVALHAPLLQAVSRVGCFFAGCCFGALTQTVFGFLCYSAQSGLYAYRYPCQLYSAGALLAIFLFLFFYLQKKRYRPGVLFAWSIILVALQRFLIDFLRGDREYFLQSECFFSLYQYIALGIIAIGCILGVYIYRCD